MHSAIIPIKTQWRFLRLYLVFLLLPIIVDSVGPNLRSEIIPKFGVMALWAIPIALYLLIRNPFNRLVCLLWMLWFVVGSINMAASYIKYGDFYLLDVDYSAIVYISYISSFILAIFIYEVIAKRRSRKYKDRTGVVVERPRDKVFYAILLIFPFLWITSIYLSHGSIPMLRVFLTSNGMNIEESMYESDFGPLYGFSVVLAMSMIFIFDKLINCKTLTTKIGFASLLLIVGALSISTGKRMFIIVFILAALAWMIKTKGQAFFRSQRLISWAALGALIYVGAMIIRKGLDTDAFSSSAQVLASVGVEYRDFVYAVEKFSATDLYDHNWATSTVVAGINSKLLDLFGIDKIAVLHGALGYVSKSLFSGGFFGVRTGLISELFLAYGFFGLPVIGALGLLIARLGRALNESHSKVSLMFLSTVYGLVSMWIVAQSIDVVGCIVVLLYTWIVYKMINLLFGGNRVNGTINANYVAGH